MVIKGQDPLKIEKKPVSPQTANHVISLLYLFRVVTSQETITNNLPY